MAEAGEAIAGVTMFGFGKTKDGKPTLPTVRFDPSRVTEAVKADLWANIQEFEDLPIGKERVIYDAALETILRGGALHIVAEKLTSLGMGRSRAGEIARYLNRRASHIMSTDRMLATGIIKARWLWSGACSLDGHVEADKQRYDIRFGRKINGRLTFPGVEPGCSCVHAAVVPGFGD